MRRRCGPGCWRPTPRTPSPGSSSPRPPPLLNAPAYGADGSLFIGSNFGQLRRRGPSGTWSSIDTGTIEPITAVAVQGDRLTVGTCQGRILSTAGDPTRWTLDHTFDQPRCVLSLHVDGSRLLVLAGRPHNASALPAIAIGGLEVHVFEGSTRAKPTLLRTIDLSLPMPATGERAPHAILNRGYYFVSAHPGLERLDLKAGTWKTLSQGHEVTHLRASGDGTLLTAFKAQGIFSKLSVSGDDGQTWTSVQPPPYPVNDVRMDSGQSGTATRFEPGLTSVALQWLRYDAGSRSWPLVWAAPPTACVRTLRDATGVERFCVSRGGSVSRIDTNALTPEFLAD